MTRRNRPNQGRRALAAAGRDVRNDQIRNLLARLERGHLTPDEVAALRAYVEPVLAEAEQLRATVGGQQSVMRRHHEQLDAAHRAIEEAEARAEKAEAALERDRAERTRLALAAISKAATTPEPQP
ncbi:hypothetical protein ACFYWN_12065 [Streptomyces sp. NPDC002917]|uniref:hypothetical protein n=1 Tax=Streptomyces sp. NPDC002917 TaxID=3364671 RepID=UPI0036C81603